MSKRYVKHIKLTLNPAYHAEAIAVIKSIEPSKLAWTVTWLLAQYPRLVSGVAAPLSSHVAMPEPAPISTVIPSATKSRVNLSVGFDALDD